MTPIQMPYRELEPVVDMSPDAIMARLEMVGQLNDLCRFLASGTLLPREGEIVRSGSSAATVGNIAASAPRQREPRPGFYSVTTEHIE